MFIVTEFRSVFLAFGRLSRLRKNLRSLAPTIWLAASLGLWLACCMVPASAMAQQLPWRASQIDLNANNEPLNNVLTRMFTQHGMASTISTPVASAKVNGKLKGAPGTVFRELADTYGLTWYYNGSVVYVYSATEMESRMLQVNPGDVARVERTLSEMRLFDSRFPLKKSSTEGQLLVTGPPQYVQIVADIASRVAGTPSQPTREVDLRVFKLKHARAADTVVNIGGTETTIPGVARILNEILGSGRGDFSSMQTAKTLPVNLPGLRGKGQISVGRPETIVPKNLLSGADPSGSPSSNTNAAMQPLPTMGGESSSQNMDSGRLVSYSGTNKDTTQVPNHAQRPATDGPVIRADQRINAVIVRDTQERMRMYARLINELDISTPLLEIEATVIDIAHSKSEQLGIDWRVHGSRVDVSSSPNDLAGNGPGANNNRNFLGYQLPAVSSGKGLVGTLLFGSERTSFVSRINALAEKGDANLVSKPRVLTLDNTEAVLQSTKDFYVRVAGRDQTDLFNVSSGLVLRVTPTLIEDPKGARIKLNIRIEDGNTNDKTVDQIPIVSRNSISTQAVVGDGNSLLIGGYTIEEKTRDSSGIPVLSSIPGLKWLFGQKSTSAKRTERIFMITPRLVKPEALNSEAAAQLHGSILNNDSFNLLGEAEAK
jgi:type III secretion protein C